MSRRWTLVAVVVVVLSIPSTTGAQISCVDPPSGLQSWWPGDNNAADIFGAWNGALVGGTTYDDGIVDAAFSFDGSGAYVEIADAEAGDFGSGAFTVAFWLNANSMGAAESYLVGKSHPDGGLGWDIRLGDGTVKVVGVNGWDFNIISAALVSTGQWHHIAVTSDAGQVTLYIDGEQAGTSARSTISTSSNPLRFGFTTNYGGIGLDGSIDEVTFFNRALGPTEVALITDDLISAICRPCAPTAADAVAWWRGENDAVDEVGGFDGTLGGDTLYVAGKIGNAFYFDGSGDFVEMPAAPAWDFGTGSFSVAAWINSIDSTDPDKIVVWDNGVANMGIWGLFLDASGIPHFQICDQNGYPSCPEIQGTQGLDDGAWHFVAGVRDATAGTLRLWVDGAEVAAAVSDGGANVIGAANNRATIGSGGWGGGGTFHSFHGTIDEVMVVGGAMTAAEIAALANASDAGVCTGCNPAPGDVVSWWQGEDDVTDAVGGNDGTLENDATFAAGLVGSAFTLPTGNDFVEIPHDESLSFGTTDPMTIDFWAYRTTDDVPQHILSKRFDCYSTPWNYQLSWIPSENGLCFGSTAGGYVCATGDIFPLATWTHMAVVFDGSEGRIYLDGELKAAAAMSLGPDTNSPPLRFGSVADCDDLDYGFRGLLDEIEIHDRALSLGEIQSIYNAGAFGKCEIGIAPEIFSDGFEDGNTSAWSSTSNPT